MVVKKKKGSAKPLKGHAKQAQNAVDKRELEYILKSLNPLPALAVTAMRLVAPILARIAVRYAVTYAVKRLAAKRKGNPVSLRDIREEMAGEGAKHIQSVLAEILERIQIQG